MAQQAQSDLPVCDNGAAACAIPGRSRQRSFDAVAADPEAGERRLSQAGVPRPSEPEQGEPQRQGQAVARAAQAKISAVMVLNQPSAKTASCARCAAGASLGLTPPAPCTSARPPLLGV